MVAAAPLPGTDAARLAAQASALCRDQGLPAAMAWIKAHVASWSAPVRAQALQEVTLALPADHAWQALHCTAVRNADAVRDGLDRYRHALRALAHAMEAFDAPVLAGRTGFLDRSRAVRATLGELSPAALPGPLRRAAADAAAGLRSMARQPTSDDLRMWLAVCMGWQSALPAAASALDAGALPQLWFDYALHSEEASGREARRQFWTLAIVGSNLRPAELSHRQVDPCEYHGEVIQGLRRGDAPRDVCEDFHLDQEPVLERWVHRVADTLHAGRSLQRDDALPRW